MSVSSIDNKMDHLYPPFRELVEKILAQANREAFHQDGSPKFAEFKQFKLFEGYRSNARQAWLYAQGRSRPGEIVTYLKTPRMHGKGLAADIVWYDHKNQPRWGGSEALWDILGHAARTFKCVHGGDWKMKDYPHVEASNPAWKTAAANWISQQSWK